MGHFDKIIESASSISDNNVEPHPLWEYPSTALGPPQQLLELDLTKKVPGENVVYLVVLEFRQEHAQIQHQQMEDLTVLDLQVKLVTQMLALVINLYFSFKPKFINCFFELSL